MYYKSTPSVVILYYKFMPSYIQCEKAKYTAFYFVLQYCSHNCNTLIFIYFLLFVKIVVKHTKIKIFKQIQNITVTYLGSIIYIYIYRVNIYCTKYMYRGWNFCGSNIEYTRRLWRPWLLVTLGPIWKRFGLLLLSPSFAYWDWFAQDATASDMRHAVFVFVQGLDHRLGCCSSRLPHLETVSVLVADAY